MRHQQTLKTKKKVRFNLRLLKNHATSRNDQSYCTFATPPSMSCIWKEMVKCRHRQARVKVAMTILLEVI